MVVQSCVETIPMVPTLTNLTESSPLVIDISLNYLMRSPS